MAQPTKASKKNVAARNALRRRVKAWYRCFNRSRWNDCFALLDPHLAARKIGAKDYAKSLQRFQEIYGAIHPWHVRISMHLDERPVKDPRPFAFVYAVWQDDRRDFHMFRERWVYENGEWYTRVAGLIASPIERS